MATYLPNVTDVIPEPALFTPDYSFLDKMLRRRQGLYEQGFAQVNSAYNFVNRPVTNPYSVKVRDTFLKQAQDNLKNLSSLDLSQQQNVNSARGVFEPFVKNRPVLMDMALTSHYDNQESIAESYRLKDGGKEFSEDNINYVRMQRNAFAQDDISTVGQYYNTRRSFTPYYDWNKEITDRMKDFKPSSTKIERINGMYMVTTKDASWTREEINRYLNATLSDKAKQQMRIEASVRYPDANSVGGLYINQAAREIPVIDQKLAEVEAAIKTEKNKENLESLKKMRDYYQDNKREVLSNIDNIQKGDVSFLKNNFEKLASSIYMSQTVDRISGGYSHKDIEQTIGFNQVAMMYARMAFDREENQKNRDAQAGKELPFLPVTREGKKVTTSYSSINDDVKTAEKVANARFAELKDYMTTQEAFKGRSSSSITKEEVEKWVSTHPENMKVVAHRESEQALSAKRDQLATWNSGAENYAKQQMGLEYEKLTEYRQELAAADSKVPANMRQTTTMVLNGKTIEVPSFAPPPGKNKYYYEKGPFGKSQYDMDMASARAANKYIVSNKLGINGEALEKRFADLKKEYNSKTNTIDVSKNSQGFTMNVDDKRYKSTQGYLEAITGANGKISGIKWFPTMDGFDITFKLDDVTATNPIDREALKRDLKASLGTDQVTYNSDTDVFTVGKIAPTIAPRLDPYGGINPTHRMILSSLENFYGSPGMTRESTMFTLNGKAGSHSFHVVKLFGNTPETNSYILHVNNKPIDRPYSSTLAAYSVAASLVENPVALSTVLSGN